jgi:hypothetical protein
MMARAISHLAAQWRSRERSSKSLGAARRAASTWHAQRTARARRLTPYLSTRPRGRVAAAACAGTGGEARRSFADHRPAHFPKGLALLPRPLNRLRAWQMLHGCTAWETAARAYCTNPKDWTFYMLDRFAEANRFPAGLKDLTGVPRVINSATHAMPARVRANTHVVRYVYASLEAVAAFEVLARFSHTKRMLHPMLRIRGSPLATPFLLYG